jgi:hypothetical protein
VVRNAQLEIENSQLNRSIAELRVELKKREKQLFVVGKARNVPSLDVRSEAYRGTVGNFR